MKRPLQLSLAIALALGGTNAMALGLGPVHVKSKLNQPLDAEIPVIQGTAGEAEGLLVSLAAAEDFERIGISRGHLNIPLDFSVGKGANGQTVIRVTSKEPVRDSYLDFLVEANWPKGRLLREYTVLLDPPVTAPARSAPPTSVASAPAPTPAVKPAIEPEKHAEKPAKVAKAEKPPKPEKEPVAATEAKPAPVAAAPRRVIEGEYGPTKAGETLSGIARSARPDSSVNMDQMMLALLKNNPNAFYKDNINALKRGAILRIPSADEAKAIGSASEAAAQVRSQIEDWQGGRASPTRVAAAAAPEKPASPAATPAKAPKATASSKSPSERLELVPPKAGKDSIAMADQPGSGGSTGTGTEIKRELARTKEALTARDQEAGELKSRVKELEDLKGKNDRLINLKDSEIADLQQKLKELQAKSDAIAKSAPTKPAATPSAPVATATPATAPAETPKPAATSATSTPSTTPTIDKKDIWGDSATASASARPGEAHAPSTPAATAPSHEPASTAPTAAATTPPAPAVTTPSTSTPAGATSSTTPAPTTSPVASTTPASGATVTPLPASPPTTATTDTATKPAATTPAKKPTPPPVNKAPVIEPAWYEAPWVKPAALGGGVLLVLAGLLGMRKRKPAAAAAGAARGSIADQFGDSPYHEQHGGSSSDVMEAEAASLREQIARDPRKPGLYLELLSLYYAERDVAKFEETAAEMRAHVTDPHLPEWQEAQAMGQELAPHNPLFSGEPVHDAYYDARHAGNADTVERPVLDEDDFAFADHGTPVAAAPSAHESEFGFGLGNAPTPARAQPTVHVPAPVPAEDTFSFDDLPPLESPKPTKPVATPAAKEPAPTMKETPNLDDDFFSGEDATGTKLDLAKAYIDMGDPDGARSMLEEVVAEGSDAQKAEAHRLISELR